MRQPPGKRRTREHVIADLAVNYVERQALLCGYTGERIYRDYGIDLEVTTFNEYGEIEPMGISMQVKATDTLSLLSEHLYISYRIERSHLVLWLAKPTPVILVVFDAIKTRAYWLYVQKYFQELEEFNLFEAGKTITVRIPVANRVNIRSMRRFAQFRDSIIQQMKGLFHG